MTEYQPTEEQERLENLKGCSLEYVIEDFLVKITGQIENGRTLELTERRDNSDRAPIYEGTIDGKILTPEEAIKMFDRYEPTSNEVTPTRHD